MSRKRLAAIAVIVAFSTSALTACETPGFGGNDSSAPSTPPGASAPAEEPGGAGGSGEKLSLEEGTAKENAAEPETGDWAEPKDTDKAWKWVQLSASKAGDLDPVVVNGAGYTLYRFEEDTPDPSMSNCTDECATNFPPVLVAPEGKVYLDGMPESAVGTVKRDDGTYQVTVGGWPVYRFSGDKEPGMTNGHGKLGKWYGVAPDGKQAEAVPAEKPEAEKPVEEKPVEEKPEDKGSGGWGY